MFGSLEQLRHTMTVMASGGCTTTTTAIYGHDMANYRQRWVDVEVWQWPWGVASEADLLAACPDWVGRAIRRAYTSVIEMADGSSVCVDMYHPVRCSGEPGDVFLRSLLDDSVRIIGVDEAVGDYAEVDAKG